ncbi:MAG: bifunctional 3'-5' exonuclease/DNA polymerase, partial [Actinomycetota bacterium]|nr:bifunctional 3'-5' exonuclease/DNA polymerase [Actinomycetota bacterium]
MPIALSRAAAVITAVEFDESGEEFARREIAEGELPAWVREREPRHPRWVWNDTSRWYPALLEAGVRVERCVDLRLCHRILRRAASAAGSELAKAARSTW